jgi:hypothetical protein
MTTTSIKPKLHSTTTTPEKMRSLLNRSDQLSRKNGHQPAKSESTERIASSRSWSRTKTRSQAL